MTTAAVPTPQATATAAPTTTVTPATTAVQTVYTPAQVGVKVRFHRRTERKKKISVM